MLPLEDQIREEVKAEHQEQIAQSHQLLRFALEIIGSDAGGNLNIPKTPIPGVGENSLTLTLGLYAKACKLFRCVMLLGERGFASEVMILTRCLFDTTLSLHFIIKEKVSLKRDGKPFNPDPSHPFTTEFRTSLYTAYCAYKAEKRYRQWDEQPELKSSMHLRGDPKVIAEQAVGAKAQIGEKWWNALKGGLAGLSIRNLADSLGVLSYYIIMYGDQSDVTHAGDAFMHFDLGEDECYVGLSPSSEDIGGHLKMASLVFLSCLSGIHERVQLGEEADKGIDEFAKSLGVPSA